MQFDIKADARLDRETGRWYPVTFLHLQGQPPKRHDYKEAQFQKKRDAVAMARVIADRETLLVAQRVTPILQLAGKALGDSNNSSQ